MKNDYTDSKFKKLLDKLQQDSWQLELLISGFAIFGLITALGPINNGLNEASAIENYSKILYLLAKIACNVLIVNLVIHVVIRGLWIGAIGLRYVSGEIDYDSLNYSKRFTNYLKDKVGSFDKYIGILENYCSILFAVTFLFLFYIISVFMVILIILLAGNFFIESGLFSEVIGFMLLGFFALFFLFLSLFVFIDFITQGYLKKKEWSSFLYFPLYRVFSIITLSFLYRPLVYNFLDNKFGKKIILILIPVYIFGFYLTTINNVRSNYISNEKTSSIYYSSTNNYINSLGDKQYIKGAAIQSKIITNNYLKIFIPFRKKMEDIILEQNKDLKPIKDKRGLQSNFFTSNTNTQKRDSITAIYLKAFQKTYFLKIDSLQINPTFLVTEINNQLGLETVVSLKDFTQGKHIININRNSISKKTKRIENEDVIHIPFWYYKQ